MSSLATHVVVDGSNIATEGRNSPSLKQLDEGVRAFLDQYPHDICTVVVDATFGRRIDASELQLFQEALENGEVITPPAGTIGRGDKFLLEIADRSGAAVFSNDSFQEFHGEYPWLFNNGRLIGGKAVPEVGWVFAFRSPVRGPRSRQAVKEARLPEKRTPERRTSENKKVKPAITPRPPRLQRGNRVPTKPLVPVNAPMPFVEFIAEHPIGSIVNGEVVEFASHGAYVMVGKARCYSPTKLMGDPPPRGPKDVLEIGETRSFVVHALDAPRRGIDLALPEFKKVNNAMKSSISEIDEKEETMSPVKKTAKKKAVAKKKPVARKVTAKKVVAKKVVAKKVVAKKRPAVKRAAVKKAVAKRPAAKKTAVKKAVAKRPAAKKTAVKKAVATKRSR